MVNQYLASTPPVVTDNYCWVITAAAVFQKNEALVKEDRIDETKKKKKKNNAHPSRTYCKYSRPTICGDSIAPSLGGALFVFISILIFIFTLTIHL